MTREQIGDIAAAFGLPLSGGMIGGAISSADVGHINGAVVGAIIGAVASLLSVVIRGRYRLKELAQTHATEEMKLKTRRLRKKLTDAGIDPDTD